jgi:hypothetical protein
MFSVKCLNCRQEILVPKVERRATIPALELFRPGLAAPPVRLDGAVPPPSESPNAFHQTRLSVWLLISVVGFTFVFVSVITVLVATGRLKSLQKSAGASPAENQWVDASKFRPSRSGNTSVLIGPISSGSLIGTDLLSGMPYLSSGRFMQIYIHIKNENLNRKVDYKSWQTQVGSAGQLLDNFGNAYRLVDYPTSIRPAAMERAAGPSIYPGKETTDLLLFEPPVENAEYLRLELPGENVGEPGSFRFQIPCSMWKE